MTLLEKLRWRQQREAGPDALCGEAADEIERLLAIVRTQYDALADARDALRNDFEPDNQSRAYKRATEALRWIADHSNDPAVVRKAEREIARGIK